MVIGLVSCHKIFIFPIITQFFSFFFSFLFSLSPYLFYSFFLFYAHSLSFFSPCLSFFYLLVPFILHCAERETPSRYFTLDAPLPLSRTFGSTHNMTHFFHFLASVFPSFSYIGFFLLLFSSFLSFLFNFPSFIFFFHFFFLSLFFLCL